VGLDQAKAAREEAISPVDSLEASMTSAEQKREHAYWYHERLAILGCYGTPPADLHNTAVIQADAHIAALKAAEKQNGFEAMRKAVE
jgi:hypothetical protein